MSSFILPPPRQTAFVEPASERLPTALPKRLALWEIEGSLQCSIIGTCLGDQDLLAAIRKHHLQVDENAQSYDIHSYSVRAASQDCALARTLNKLLERRFAGAVRLVARATAPDEIQSVWERLRDSGQVAAGYWAVMSHAHVPTAVKTRVFGQVHMLSHLHGHGASQLATRLAEAQQRGDELEARLRRSETAKLAVLAERDAARAAAASKAPLPAAHANLTRPDRALRHAQEKLAKYQRALIIARTRARQAESQASRLALAAVPARTAPAGAPPAGTVTRVVPAAKKTSAATGQRILYIGGRTAIVPHLRSAAEARVAAFFHHDGGIEDNLQRIGEMIHGCDAVVCPVDCVSHGACRMAKAICQRLNRRFLPIPSASRSGFERALDQLVGEPPHRDDAQLHDHCGSKVGGR
jgi:Uncharacterized protein conserved in bacteria (DUF2325)